MGNDSQITIGYDATAALLGGGGIPRYTRELLRALIALDDPRLRFVVFVNSLRQSPDGIFDFVVESKNAKLVRRRIPGPLLMHSWKMFGGPGIETLYGEQCDIVHFPANYMCPAKGALFATVHDLAFLDEDDQSALGGRYFKRAFPKLLPRTQRVLTTSKYVADQVAKQYGIDREKFYVTSAGVDLELFTTNQEAIELDFDLPEEYVLCITDRSPRKRAYLIGDVAKLLGDVQFVVVGLGGNPVTDQDPPNIQSLPRVSDESLAHLYRNASATLLTTRAEGFGFPVIESLACGTPVVCGKHSSLQEIGGDLVDYTVNETAKGFAETLCNRIQTPTDSLWLESAAEHVQQFNWHSIARRMADCYIKYSS